MPLPKSPCVRAISSPRRWLEKSFHSTLLWFHSTIFLVFLVSSCLVLCELEYILEQRSSLDSQTIGNISIWSFTMSGRNIPKSAIPNIPKDNVCFVKAIFVAWLLVLHGSGNACYAVGRQVNLRRVKVRQEITTENPDPPSWDFGHILAVMYPENHNILIYSVRISYRLQL